MLTIALHDGALAGDAACLRGLMAGVMVVVAWTNLVGSFWGD